MFSQTPRVGNTKKSQNKYGDKSKVQKKKNNSN